MKKKIIIVVSVAVATLILLSIYLIFLKKDDSVNTDAIISEVAELSDRHTIKLRGYDPDDEGWVLIRDSAYDFAKSNPKIGVEEQRDGAGFEGVTVISGDKTDDIPYGDFFRTLYDGTRYAFDGESLIATAILEAEGREVPEIALKAFEGYDADGDLLTAAGMPFVFKALERRDIYFLSIKNATGSYSIFQENGTFYYGDSSAAQFDSEKFSLLTTNCRYPVTYGKMEMPEGKTWADYGLDPDSPETGSYSIISVPEDSGNRLFHTVCIGKLSSTGSYYFARYIGAYQDKDGGIIANLSKPTIYYLPTDSVNGSIDSSVVSILSTELITPITATEAVVSLDNIRVGYLDLGINALIKNMSAFSGADNIAPSSSTALSKVISDKKHAGDYSSYEGGWLENKTVFCGFSSSDGKATHIDASLARYSVGGNYKLTLGVLRDDSNGALLPSSFTVTATDDGTNFFEVGKVTPKQDDRTLKDYTVEFTSDKKLLTVRIAFDVPQVVKSYVVFDEIRVFVDGGDAQPTDSTSGIWRLVSPSEYIAAGRNFAYLDLTNFNTLVQDIASLSGVAAVGCGFSENGDANQLKTEVLAEFGLDEPWRYYSFDYDGVTVEFYVSHPDENYYAYSVFSGYDSSGTFRRFTYDVIVTLSLETYPWLEWDFFEILDHYLISMYIGEIEEVTVSFDGKDYVFDLTADSTRTDIVDVSYNGKSFDVREFKLLYQSLLSIYLHDEYTPAEGDVSEEYLRVKVVSETRSPELVFYRVSATRCYFTIDGDGSYAALVKSVNLLKNNVLAYISGKPVTQPK